jgi:hypothetical protein
MLKARAALVGGEFRMLGALAVAGLALATEGAVGSILGVLGASPAAIGLGFPAGWRQPPAGCGARRGGNGVARRRSAVSIPRAPGPGRGPPRAVHAPGPGFGYPGGKRITSRHRSGASRAKP